MKKEMKLIRLDKITKEHLEYVSKQLGMDGSSCIRMLINDEYRWMIDTKKYLKDMDKFYKERERK